MLFAAAVTAAVPLAMSVDSPDTSARSQLAGDAWLNARGGESQAACSPVACVALDSVNTPVRSQTANSAWLNALGGESRQRREWDG